MTSWTAYRDEVLSLNQELRELTGADEFLYSNNSGDGLRIRFRSATHLDWRSARDHMANLVVVARADPYELPFQITEAHITAMQRYREINYGTRTTINVDSDVRKDLDSVGWTDSAHGVKPLTESGLIVLSRLLGK